MLAFAHMANVTQIGVRVDDELLALIERARGPIPRERWMRRALGDRAREELEATEPTTRPTTEGTAE